MVSKCYTCKNYDKENNACDASPYEIEEVVCLLKNILCVLLNEEMDDSDGENWKR